MLFFYKKEHVLYLSAVAIFYPIISKKQYTPWILKAINISLSLRSYQDLMNTVFWDSMSCRLIEIYQRFGGMFCL
jgi:hypothetical protein